MQEEIWKDIEGFEGYYQISNMGRVKALGRTVITHFKDGRGDVAMYRKERISKPSQNIEGYLTVQLSKNNIRERFRVHRLVALAFVPNPNPEKYDMVNHIDGITDNNRASNLEWLDNRGNQIHAIKIGTNKYVGTNSHWSKLTEEQVRFIRDNYKPRGEYNCCTMAKMFDVTPNVIHNVIKGKSYYVVK